MSEEIKTETMCVDMDDIMKRIEKDRKEAQERSASLKNRVIKELKKVGAATATIRYEGCGDSGSVEDIEVRDKDNKEIKLPEDPAVTVVIRSAKFSEGKWINTSEEKLVSLYAALEDLAYDALEGHHPGWEINDGAYGKLEIFVEKETAILAHNTRITDVEYWENEL